MALITAAVGGTGAAMGLATLGHFAFRSSEAEVEVSSAALAKTLGVAMCLPADCWRKTTRHVTMIGDLLVISRTPGSADTSLQLGGTHVDVEGSMVQIVSASGALAATFWLNSPAEAGRWAKELDRSSESVPKMLSLNRQQLEKIKAEAALWQEKISLAKDSKRHRDRLLVEVAEKEQKLSELNAEIDSFKDLPKTLSLDRHQIKELEMASKEKESQVAALQGQLNAFQAMPKMLSLNVKQIAQLEQKALLEEGKIADLQQELGAFQEQQKRLALESSRVAALQSQQGLKDGLIDSLRSKISHFQDLPKLLSVRREKAESKESEQDARIAELERQLAQAAELPKMLSLNRRQAQEVVHKAAQSEAELSALRRQMLHRRAQEMLKPKVISTTTTTYEGPRTVVKKVIVKPSSTILEEPADSLESDSAGKLMGA